jgi:DNA-binding NarL/FixJ family response regulator
MSDWLLHPWPWYVAGPLIGLFPALLLLLGNRPFGVSSTLRHVCAGRVVYPAGWQELAAETDVRSPVALLSQRQLEVLRLVADGRRNDEIAEALFVSQNTVKFHIHEIYSKLGVRNRVQAAQMLLAEDGR